MHTQNDHKLFGKRTLDFHMNGHFSRSSAFNTSLATLASIALLTGCQGDSQDIPSCGGGLDDYYDIYGMTGAVTNISHKNSSSPGYVYYDLEEEYSGATSEHDDIVLMLEFDVTSYNAQVSPDLPFIPFLAQAFACSPKPPEFTEMITEINVTASQSFSETLAVGDSLGDVITLNDVTYELYSNHGYKTSGSNYPTLNEVFEESAILAASYVHLGIDLPPAQSGEYIFFIEVVLDNGETYTYETPAISLIGSDS